MTPFQTVKKLDKTISEIPISLNEVERDLWNRIQKVLKEIEISPDGKIKNTLANIKLIKSLHNEVRKALNNTALKNSFKDLKNVMTGVVDLQQNYFSSLNLEHGADKVIQDITKDALKETAKALVDSGVAKGIQKHLEKVLLKYTKSGGDYSSMMDDLRSLISPTDKSAGIVNRYAKQISVDAANQLAARVNQAIVSDLGFEWYRYVGSNVESTRDWCTHMTKKEWVHVSEFPEILKGKIDGKQVEINEDTGLWFGAIEGTDKSNLTENRGGWQCGHQFYGVPTEVVPKELSKRF